MSGDAPGAIRHPKSLRQLHWLLAVLLPGLILFGLWMGQLDRADPLKGLVLPWHLAAGGLVAVLAILRLAIRRRHPETLRAAAARTTPLRRRLAGVVHGAFYVLLIGLPLLGLGVWLLDPHLGPAPFGEGVSVGNWSERLHRLHYLGAWSVAVLLPVHIAGALIPERAGHRPLSRML